MNYVWMIHGYREDAGHVVWNYYNTVRGTRADAVAACKKLLISTSYTGLKYTRGEKI